MRLLQNQQESMRLNPLYMCIIICNLKATMSYMHLEPIQVARHTISSVASAPCMPLAFSDMAATIDVVTVHKLWTMVMYTPTNCIVI